MSCEFQKSHCHFFLVPLCTYNGILFFKCELPSKRVEENIQAAPLQREGFINGKKKKRTNTASKFMSCGSLQSGLCKEQLISGSTQAEE